LHGITGQPRETGTRFEHVQHDQPSWGPTTGNVGQQRDINQSINLFVMKHSTCDIAVTALTGTIRLKALTVVQSNKHEFKRNLHIKITNNQHLKQTK